MIEFSQFAIVCRGKKQYQQVINLMILPVMKHYIVFPISTKIGHHQNKVELHCHPCPQ
jgi:hypothetical protein